MEEEHKLRTPLLQNVNDAEDFSPDFASRLWAEFKCLWRIAGCAFLGALATIGSGGITHAFVGRIGNLELAAFSLVIGVLVPSLSIFLVGMSNVLSTLCGQAFGAKNHSMLGIYLQRSWILLFGLYVLLLPSFIFTVPILRFLGQPEDIVELSGRVALWCIPMFLSLPFNSTTAGYLNSQSKNMIIAGSATVGTVITTLLNWMLVLKCNMGLWGAIISLNIGSWVPTILTFLYVTCGGCPFTWSGFSMEAFCELWPFLKLSMASGAMLCLDFLYYRILVLMTGQVKDTEIILDSLSICMTINTLAMSIPLGFCIATSVRVANQLGAGNPNGAKFSISVSLASSFILGIIMSVVVLVFRSHLGYLFTNSTSVQLAVAKLSILLACTVFLNSIQQVFIGVVIGSGKQARVVSVNLVCFYFIGIPFGILLCFQFDLGIQGIWIGLLCGTTIQIIALAIISWQIKLDEKIHSKLSENNGMHSMFSNMIKP